MNTLTNGPKSGLKPENFMQFRVTNRQWQPKSVKIYEKLTSRDVTQAFKNLNWALIMIPENDRPITSVKTEIS